MVIGNLRILKDIKIEKDVFSFDSGDFLNFNIFKTIVPFSFNFKTYNSSINIYIYNQYFISFGANKINLLALPWSSRTWQSPENLVISNQRPSFISCPKKAGRQSISTDRKVG
uniref:hypothetical protein n=1 Tax=Cephaleuros parasiticus TaxID=173370 RepID=UPI001EDDE4A0|nr:hypothetical protein MFQ79_pgp088 [Cephaleuros parasiticus]UIB38974.1 hypothetical protein [Cephaleuros parasiticus]